MVQALQVIARTVGGPGADAETFPWHRLRYEHTSAVRAALADRYAPATANRMLAGLRGVLRECWRLGLVSAEESQRAADLPPVRGETLLRGRALSGSELASLFETCRRDGSPAGARDGAMLAVLYGAGLRRSELVGLDRADWAGDGSLKVRRGKGRKERLVHVVSGAALVEAWLRWRGEAGGHACAHAGAHDVGSGGGPLFCHVNKGGRVLLRRLSDQAVLFILRRRGAAAGVQEFAPHDLRRSMISDLLDAGADLVTVQKIAGHANVSTTGRYDRRGEDAKRRAAGLLRIPTGGE